MNLWPNTSSVFVLYLYPAYLVMPTLFNKLIYLTNLCVGTGIGSRNSSVGEGGINQTGR